MYRTKLTDAEYNAILKLTSNTHLDDAFDAYDCGEIDMFIDVDNCCEDYGIEPTIIDGERFVDLRTGLAWLYDGLAYTYEEDGLTKKEGQLIDNLFKEFEVEELLRLHYIDLMKQTTKKEE